MHLLEPVLEHGAIAFLEKIFVDVNSVGRVNAEEVCVVGRVVDLAHAQAVGNCGEATFVAVGQDVGRVQELGMGESADGAAVFIGVKNFATEFALVDSAFHCLFHVPT